MTDKEWKELCDWAKSLVKNFNKNYVIALDVYENYFILRKHRGIIEIHCKGLIDIGCWKSENRTAKQIKAIIENLL
jgi:hypothetical protein